MDFLVALIPSLLYGFVGIVLVKIGGDNRQQTMGQLGGGFLVAAALAIIVGIDMPLRDAAIAFCAGLVIAVAIQIQLKSFETLGVSRVMPLTTGGQLIGIALLGVLLFGEWLGSIALPVGLLGVLLVVIGVVLTAWTDRSRTQTFEPEEGLALLPAPSVAPETGSQPVLRSNPARVVPLDWRKGLIQVGFSTLLFIVYIVGLRWFAIDPLKGFFPQAVGFLILGFILTSPRVAPNLGPGDSRFTVGQLKSLIAGVMWGLGVVIMQYSQVKTGVAVGFTLSQLGVVFSTFGGILILKEHRTGKEMKVVTVGIVVLILGAVLLGVAKTLDSA